MAMRQYLDTQRAVQAAIAAVPNLEPPPVQLEVNSLPRTEAQQTVLAFTSAEQNGDYELQEIELQKRRGWRWSKKTRRQRGVLAGALSARMPNVATS